MNIGETLKRGPFYLRSGSGQRTWGTTTNEVSTVCWRGNPWSKKKHRRPCSVYCRQFWLHSNPLPLHATQRRKSKGEGREGVLKTTEKKCALFSFLLQRETKVKHHCSFCKLRKLTNTKMFSRRKVSSDNYKKNFQIFNLENFLSLNFIFIQYKCF